MDNMTQELLCDNDDGDYDELPTLEKMDRHNKSISKKKATIKIKNMKSDTCPELIFAVDFDGHNEGSYSPMKNEQEVQEQVKYLMNRYKDEYKIELIDERKPVKQEQLGSNTLKHDEVVTFKIKYGLDYRGNRDWGVGEDNPKGSCFVSYHSSGCYGSYNGNDNPTLEEKLILLKKDLIQDKLKEGYKEENIKFVSEEMNEEKYKEWKQRATDSIKRDIEYNEKNIVQHKSEMTKALKEKVLNEIRLKKLEAEQFKK